MIDERIRELIQSGIDGELDESGREELSGILETSAEARMLSQELQQLQDILGEVEPIEPPAELHSRITHSITLPAAKMSGSGFFSLSGFVRYGLTAAAGLLIAVGLYEFRPGAMEQGDLDKMVGTIMRDQQVTGETLDHFSFALDELSSEALLLERDDSLVLEVSLDANGPVEITMDFVSDGLTFDAIAQTDSELSSIEFADQEIQIKGSGKQHFAVMLRRDALQSEDNPASIKLQYSSNGVVVREGILITR